MDQNGFIQKQNSYKVVVLKDFRNVWSKFVDANFHMKVFVCFSATKSVAPPLLLLPVKSMNRGVLEGCDIQGANITTALKGFINSTLFLIWLELFAYSVPDSVAHPLVLVYDCCCSHSMMKL